MRKIIYFILFLGLLSSCNRERKPLEILPMTAEDGRMINDSTYERKDYPIPNFFYFKNFKDDKQCFKELLRYIEDSISVKIARGEMKNEAFFCKKNKGYFVGDEGDTDEPNFFLYFTDSLALYYQWFSTLSDYTIGVSYIDEFPQRCDYKYHIVRNGKAAIVYFDYKEFNTDVWQKFINVVFYDRDSIRYKDRKKYKLWIPGQARNWRNWSAPTRYCLLNQCTREIECVITYPLAENYDAFTMEIR